MIVIPAVDVRHGRCVRLREGRAEAETVFSDDPVAMAMRGLIDSASGHEHQIALLWSAVCKLSTQMGKPISDCVPCDAQRDETFDAAEMNRLVK